MIRRASHEERVRLAGEICDEVKGVLRGDLRAFVIFASIAKDVDGPYSDLEMMAITTDSYEEYCSEFMRDGIRCEVDFVPYKSAIKQAGTVDSFWSVRADQWHRFLPVYLKEGDDCLVNIKQAAKEALLKDGDFRHALLDLMLVFAEDVCSLQNAWESEVKSDILTALFDVSKIAVQLVALVNRYFYQSWRNAWEESKKLKNLPRDFSRLIEIVHGEVETSLQTRYNAALELWENVKVWVKGQGIEWTRSDLKLPKKEA